jgi:hypothetical protein
MNFQPKVEERAEDPHHRIDQQRDWQGHDTVNGLAADDMDICIFST